MHSKKMPRSGTRFPQRRPERPQLQQVVEPTVPVKKTNIFEITRGESILIDEKDKSPIRPLPH